MTEMINPNGSATGRRYPTVACGGGNPTVLSLLPTAKSVAYRPDELSYAESARLTRAALEADAAIVTARDGIRQALRNLVKAFNDGEAAVRKVEDYTAGHRLADAADARRRVVDRHAGDGPEDRRDRPRWLSWWLVWPLIFLSSAYDTAFFAGTLRDALDVQDHAPWWEQGLSYLPGFGIAMALILCGSWLAVPLLRHRSRAERRATRGRLNWRVVLSRAFVRWRPDEESREPDDLPWASWPLAIGFLLMLVGVLGTWAWLRGDGLFDHRLQGPLAALLVLLTLSAIAFKASAHNPFKERDEKSRAELASSREELAELETAARAKLGEHTQTWQEFHGEVEDAAAASRRIIMRAWADIADERAQHGLTGTVAPHFVGDQAAPGAVFEGLLPAPAVRELVLGDAGSAESVSRYTPQTLADRLADALEKATEQLDRGMTRPGTPDRPFRHRVPRQAAPLEENGAIDEITQEGAISD